ncbi:cell surface protein [Bifidobacterium pullorum]|uniref:Cell surface protein n=1 Tax=Bifidobacterium pullorum TaxID=78448 RepID=A0A7V8HPX8_9BIFI|nr:cell surface protein [Bifidobacterium pullorum]
MDLGGIHDYRTGSINFTEGTVSVQNMDDVKLDDLYGSNDWPDDSTTHELKVFYLERGKGGSNCKFRFNLPAISSDQLQIAKTVVGDADPDGYTFNAYVSNSGTTEPALYTGTYVVRTVGQTAGGVEQTAENGAIVLKAGEYATLTNPDITVNATYYVVERDASEYTVTASGGPDGWSSWNATG